MISGARASAIAVPKRMSPATVYRIAKEIEIFRSLLTQEEQWLQRQPASEHRAEGYRRIDFYRSLLMEATERLGHS
jgi:hypothetical protein